MQIDSREIAVVVQGPVVGRSQALPEARLTQRCLESVRRHLPEAQLVLSTYRGADVSGLPYDVLVENEDPGALFTTGSKPAILIVSAHSETPTAAAGVPRGSVGVFSPVVFGVY